AELLRGLAQTSAAKISQVAARPAYSPQRRREASRNDVGRNTRSYNGTTRGAETMTSLLPIPRAHETTAAAYHAAGRVAVAARMEQYSVSRKKSPINVSQRWMTYVTASVCNG